MTTRLPLNLPNKKDQFESVSFVNDMTPYQQKVYIKRLNVNIQDLALVMDETRPDVAQIMDDILDGVRWNEKALLDRCQFFIHNDELIEYDSKNNTFRVFDILNGTISKPIKGQSYKDIKKTMNKLWKK